MQRQLPERRRFFGVSGSFSVLGQISCVRRFLALDWDKSKVGNCPINPKRKEELPVNLRIRLSICLAKLVSRVLQKTNRGRGTALPGYAARLLAPRILLKLSGMVRKKIIVVMGTNGKTTTNNLLCRTLEAQGNKVVCNQLGANMQNGIVSAFALAADRNGRIDAEYACIEVDELAAAEVLPVLRPDCIVLTNIFRDQLDRYGEIDIICRKMKEAIQTVPNAVLVINCDDIFSYALSCECQNPTVLYGIEEHAFPDMASEGFPDSLFCRFCGKRLSYDFFHYGHLGIWHCPHCGAERPSPACTATDIRFGEEPYGCEDAVHYCSCHEMTSFYVGGQLLTAKTGACYSVYNILAAYTALSAVHAGTDAFAETVWQFDYGNQREEEFFIDGARVRLYLAKNPVGFQQKLALLQRDAAPKDIIVQINDNAQDGKDVSWLWDINFSSFAKLHAAKILTAGLRRYDMQLRLKYEDVPCEATEDIEAAVRRLAEEGTKNIYIISNYSGLYEINRLLKRMED